MSYKLVDQLFGYQIEPGDAIKASDEDIFHVHSIEFLERGYRINYLDEYEDETISIIIDEDDKVDFYIFDDD